MKKPCLKCGKEIETLQTKATSCNMEYYKIGDQINFDGVDVIDGCIEVHGFCDSCRYWHDGLAKIKNNRLIEVTNLTLGDKVV